MNIRNAKNSTAIIAGITGLLFALVYVGLEFLHEMPKGISIYGDANTITVITAMMAVEFFAFLIFINIHFFSADVTFVVLKSRHPNTRVGAALEGCPWTKKNQQKTVRRLNDPVRFLFLLSVLIFSWLIP